MPSALPYDVIQRKAPFDVHVGTLALVQPEARRVIDDAGHELEYDALLLAIGAKPLPAVPGAITFGGPADVAAVERVLDETARIAFVVPPGSAWALPVYELAIMAATELRNRGREPQITVVTPESAPLAAFGAEAGAAISALLAERGIALRTHARVVAAADGILAVEGEPHVLADRVVALPRLTGPGVVGLPQDHDGFLPVDEHARVRGVERVYAAGDATTFALKQGGLATQQADAAAETIAADLGGAVRPDAVPARPAWAPAHRRRAAVPAGAAHPRRRAARRGGRLAAPAVVAAGQGRRALPRAAAGRRPATRPGHGRLQDLVKTG